MSTYRTPDVYIEEISVFPPSVAEVETAIPAFIGYTQTAINQTANDLVLVPTKIFSFPEFVQSFGLPQSDPIAITVVDDPVTSGALDCKSVTTPAVKYLMYYSVKLFFENGGGQCYIVSVGTYQTPAVIALAGNTTPAATVANKYGLLDGLNALTLEDEPTMIVVPEAVSLSAPDYATLAQATLAQCQSLGSRFAIFDLYDGGQAANLTPAVLTTDRSYYGNNSNLRFGATYYPFLQSAFNYYIDPAEDNVTVTYNATSATLNAFNNPPPAPAAGGGGGGGGGGAPAAGTVNLAVYNFVKLTLQGHYLTLPPSGAIAGVYAATDTLRGVWKAPANVSLSGVIAPVVKIDNAHQDNLNVDVTGGKSINAIRAFAGKGTLVWGARTLAGNDNEWRYVSVRRFFIMVEQSIKNSIYWAVFEPNDANTWVKVRGMIENYLTQKWREGALVGAAAKDAFFVRCSLGTTMTADDILNGYMNVEIGMAVARPAEFIVLKFSQLMQTS